jgi:hypothetical protein
MANAGAALDHLLWGAPDLDAEVSAFARRSGVQPAPGGVHPGRGTRNALLSLGSNQYLEIVAPDPEQEPSGSSRGKSLARLPHAQLVAWAAKARNAEETVSKARAASFGADLYEMSRLTPDGRKLAWKIVEISEHGGGLLVPFFIQWLTLDHPASDSPRGLRLTSFYLESAHPERISQMMLHLGLDVAVRPGSADRLVAVLQSPYGEIRLESDASDSNNALKLPR